MAYAIKYLFKFESSNGTTREIRVLQDGYTGEVIQRPLGRAPVLKKQQNGPVHGTSLEFYAECNVDREFIEFYTSDPKAYRVDLYAGATLLWQGYITPELYSEPDIAPPYDVQVVATDGVGELKLYNYTAQGTVSLRALLSGLLARTGLGTDIYLISSLKAGSRGAGALLDMTINLDYMAGKSCYDVLTYLLDTLHATITWWKGAWILTRETNVTFTSGKVRYFNTAGNSALLADSVQTLGSLRANPAWPVGQLSTVIDPAKNRVTVQAPWHVVTCLRNSDMGSDADWIKAKNARYETDGYVLPVNINTGTSETAVISQATSMAGLRVPMSLSVKATGDTSEIAGQAYGAVIGVLLTYKVGGVTYHLVKGSDGTPTWQQGGDIGTYIPLRTRIDFQQQLATWDSSRIEAEELTIDNIPPFLQGTTFPAGTLTVYILGYCAKIYGAYLDVVLPKGYQDILRIDNGARGEGSEVEIAIGRETTDNAYYAAFLQGLLLDSGNLITSFADANFPGGMDYLAFIARDYALSVALPRAKVTGTVYLESGIAAPPLVLTKGALNYWLQTWSWNLYEDELEIEGLTLPSASLTVESETILESNGSTVSSASGAGSSSAGSPMGGGVGTNYWEIDGTLNTLLKPKDAYAYVSSKDGLFFTGAALSGTVVPDLYVDVVNNQRVLRSPLPLITGGDQIVIDGTPGGGGGGGGATTLAGLDDTNISNPQAGQMLSWNGTKWVNTNAPTGSITSVSLAAGASNGTLHLVVNGTAQSDVAVTGLKALAYKDSLAFSEITGTASASQIPTLAISKISGLQTALDGKQPLDADLTAIAGLSGTSGFLKKTAANTWSLDTNTYLTGITSAMVTNALGYTPANVTALADYVKLNPGAVEQTIQSSISSINKGVINLWRKGNNWSFIGFSNGDTETFLGSLGFLSSSDNSAYRRTDDLHYYKIWDAGNDGASSGLDADLLDGQHGSYYAPLSALDNYLPLTAGTSKPLTDSLYIITGDTDKAIQFSYDTTHKAGAAWRIVSNGTGTLDTNYLSFQTGGSSSTATTWNNVLRLSMDNRYVGINMDAPAYQLDVNGTARVTSLKIGSATITWNSNGYLHIDQPLVTAGDQIVISGTPGGGGGGGATTLAGLDDVAITSVANGQLLQYNGSKWVNVAASTVGRIYSPGTGISISASNVISLNSNEYYSATTSRTANTVLAAPNGSNGAASFRALVEADIPDLSGTYLPLNVGVGKTITSTSNAPLNINSTNTSTNEVGFRYQLRGENKAFFGYNANSSFGAYMYNYNGPHRLGITDAGVAHFDGYALLHAGNYTSYVNTTNFPGLNKVGTVTSVAAGTGLSGGTITTSGTISLATSGVTAGTYYKTTVDTYGRVTSGYYADLSAAINGDLGIGISDPTDADYYIAQYAGGGSSTTSYHRRPHSALYNYINGKLATAHAGLDKIGTVTSITVTGNNGLSGTGTVTTSGTITLSNAGVRSTTINGNYLQVNTNGTNADLTIPYATTASRLLRTNVGAEFDLNTALSGGGLAYNYDTVSYWVNGPSGMSYGGVAEISQGEIALSAQFAWDIVHNVENGTKSLWYRTGNNLGWCDWAEIYTSKSLTQSVVTGLIGTTTYAPYNANGYLPLTGGTITGSSTTPLVIDTTATHNYVQFKTGGAYKGHVGYSANIGMFIQAGDSTYISIADGGELKKNNTYTFYHSGNANKSDVAWTCSTLTASGNISTSGYVSVGTGGANSYVGSDAANNIFLHNSSGYVLVVDGVNVRRGNSATTATLGNSTYPWAGITATSADFRLTNFTDFHIFRNNSRGSAGITYYPAAQTTNYWNVGADPSIYGDTRNYRFYWYYSGNYLAYLTTTGIFVSTGDQVISSDLTLKENLTPVTYSVADIAKARAVEFDWKDGRGHSMGSIAQDWLGIAPALVHGEVGNMSLAYGQLALVNTILLARQSESHEERIARLEKENAELKEEVKRLRMN